MKKNQFEKEIRFDSIYFKHLNCSSNELKKLSSDMKMNYFKHKREIYVSVNHTFR